MTKFFDRLFRKKSMIKGVFIFPLISCVIIGISLNEFVNVNRTVPYIAEARHLFTWILALLCLNMLTGFVALILYYCLYNRTEDFVKNYQKSKKA